LRERGNISRYSMQEIADETFSSKSTLVRVAKALGFSGWKELMEAYQKEIRYLETHKTDIDVNLPFKADNTVMEIAGNIAALKEESVRETMEMLQPETLDKAADILTKAKRVCLFGNSLNRYLGEGFQHKMLTIGRTVEIIGQEEEGYLAETLGQGDCAVVISYSGNNARRSPVYILPELKAHKVSVIGVTSMGDNMLRDYADYVLEIASREKLYSKIGNFATEASTMFLLDMLFCCCFHRNYEENLNYKIRAAHAAERHRYSTSYGIGEDSEWGKTRRTVNDETICNQREPEI